MIGLLKEFYIIKVKKHKTNLEVVPGTNRVEGKLVRVLVVCIATIAIIIKIIIKELNNEAI